MTAEFALALPAVTLMLAATLLVGSAAMSQLRCADAARAGARAAALGEQTTQIDAIAGRVAGEEATVVVDRETAPAGWVSVTVSRPVRAGPFAVGPLRAEATSTARVEP